jgi:hypothetical protein
MFGGRFTLRIRQRPTTYVADSSCAQKSPAGNETAESTSTSTGTQRSPSMPQFSARWFCPCLCRLSLLPFASRHSIRFPVKKAQHGGRFDTVDLSASSPRSKNAPRRCSQTVLDLVSMNTHDHAQRSMQRQGNAILFLGVETTVELAGRPLFTGTGTSPPSACLGQSSNAHSLTRTLATSPFSSPRDGAKAGSRQLLPHRPHTAHPTHRRPSPPSDPVTVTSADGARCAAPAAAAAPTPTSHVSLVHDSPKLHSPHSFSRQAVHASASATTSPLNSSRSRR